MKAKPSVVQGALSSQRPASCVAMLRMRSVAEILARSHLSLYLRGEVVLFQGGELRLLHVDLTTPGPVGLPSPGYRPSWTG